MKNITSILFTLLTALASTTGRQACALDALPENSESTVQATQAVAQNVPQKSTWDRTKKRLLNAAHITKDIAIDVGVSGAITATAVLVHELAHAITAKLLLGTPIDIIMGATFAEDKKPFFSVGGIKFAGYSFRGEARVLPLDKTPANIAKLGLVILAGPATTIAYRYGMERLLRKHNHLPMSDIVNFASFWAEIYTHVIPFNLPGSAPGNDGSQFLACIGWLIQHYRGKV